MTSPARSRGFTMIEILYVIAIIATLAAILFPVFARAREQARRATCASNLMQIGAALSLYARDCEGHFPPKNNDFEPLHPYTGSVDVFFCPSDSQERTWPVRKAAKRGGHGTPVPPSSYVYKGGLTNDDRADTPIAGEMLMPSTRHGFHGDVVNVLYLGGYTKAVPADGYKPVVPPAPKPNGLEGLGGPPGMGPPPGGMPQPMAPPPPSPSK